MSKFLVTGYWEDEKQETQRLVVTMDHPIDDVDDDQVFFYIEEEAELKSMLENETFLVDNFKLLSYEKVDE